MKKSYLATLLITLPLTTNIRGADKQADQKKSAAQEQTTAQDYNELAKLFSQLLFMQERQVALQERMLAEQCQANLHLHNANFLLSNLQHIQQQRIVYQQPVQQPQTYTQPVHSPSVSQNYSHPSATQMQQPNGNPFAGHRQGFIKPKPQHPQHASNHNGNRHASVQGQPNQRMMWTMPQETFQQAQQNAQAPIQPAVAHYGSGQIPKQAIDYMNESDRIFQQAMFPQNGQQDRSYFQDQSKQTKQDSKQSNNGNS